jgi:hypothetical protein
MSKRIRRFLGVLFLFLAVAVPALPMGLAARTARP